MLAFILPRLTAALEVLYHPVTDQTRCVNPRE